MLPKIKHVPQVYKDFEIIYHDQGSDEIKLIETLTLTTEKEARRIAHSWQRASWTPGRRFSYREVNPVTKTLDESESSEIMGTAAN